MQFFDIQAERRYVAVPSRCCHVLSLGVRERGMLVVQPVDTPLGCRQGGGKEVVMLLRLTVFLFYWGGRVINWLARQVNRRSGSGVYWNFRGIKPLKLATYELDGLPWRWCLLRELATMIGQRPHEVMSNFSLFGWGSRVKDRAWGIPWTLQIADWLFTSDRWGGPPNRTEAHFALIPAGVAHEILDAHQLGAVRLKMKKWKGCTTPIPLGTLLVDGDALGYEGIVGISKDGRPVNGPRDPKRVRPLNNPVL
jgi:hypothetical protein